MISSIGTNVFTPLQPVSSNRSSQQAGTSEKNANNPNELSPEEKKQVDELKKTDAKVRAHEQAHKTVGGAYAGSIQYETVTGPDGREYAVGGEVPIDASSIPNNPEATIRKMDVVERAALAPADPSPQDFAVARQAQATRLQAQRELRELEESERNTRKEGQSPAFSPQETIKNLILVAQEKREEAVVDSQIAAENLSKAESLTTISQADAAAIFTTA